MCYALEEVRALEQSDTDKPDAAGLRRIRRSLSASLRTAGADEVLATAHRLVAARLDWLGWELINKHPAALSSLALTDVEQLSRGISSWGQADAFGTLIAGPAWQRGSVGDQDVAGWARTQDRWWRRIALVATTVLNTKSRGGRGDTARTLAVAEILLRDKDDMVVKALSWSLRTLVPWDREAVRGFLETHGPELDARVRREVRSKLDTGLKVRPRNVDPGRQAPA